MITNLNIIKKLRSPHPFSHLVHDSYSAKSFNLNLFTPYPLHSHIEFLPPSSPVMEGIIDLNLFTSYPLHSQTKKLENMITNLNIIKKLRSPHPFSHLVHDSYSAKSFNLNLFTSYLFTSYPLHSQIGFQSPSSPVMEGIIDFHHDLMFFLIYILGFVVWFLCIIGYSYYNRFPSTRDLNLLIYKHHINFIRVPYKQNHHLWLEIIWTVIPALILISIVLPSFALIYSMDEFLLCPRATLKAIGNQWYWTYNYGCSLSAQESSTDKIAVDGGTEGGDPDDHEITTSLGISYKVSDAEAICSIFRIALRLHFVSRAYDNPIRHMLPLIVLLDNPELDYTEFEKICTSTDIRQIIQEHDMLCLLMAMALLHGIEDAADIVAALPKFTTTRFFLDNLADLYTEDQLNNLLITYDVLSELEKLCRDNIAQREQEVYLTLKSLAEIQELVGDRKDLMSEILEQGCSQELRADFVNNYEAYLQAVETHSVIMSSMMLALSFENSDLFEAQINFATGSLDDESLRAYYLFSLECLDSLDFALSCTGDNSDLCPLETMDKGELREFFKTAGLEFTDAEFDEIFTLLNKGVDVPPEHRQALFDLLFSVYLGTGDALLDLEIFMEYYDQLKLDFICKQAGIEVPNNSLDAFNFSPSLREHLDLALALCSAYENNDPESSNTCVSCQVIESEPGVEGRRHFALKFDSYMLPTDMLEHNHLRLLEVDKRVVLPTRTGVRLLVSSYDVLHSWAVPALGIKLDGCPGRLNQTFIYIKKEGLYYGQCSEICGVNHAFMPIVIKAVDPEEFNLWLLRRIEVFNALAEATDTHKLKMTATDVSSTVESEVVDGNINNNNND